MDINYANLAELRFQFGRQFEIGLKAQAPVDLGPITEDFPSGTSENLYDFLGDIKGFRKWVGPRIWQQLQTTKYRLANETYEDGFAVKREQIQDDQYGVYSKRSQLLGRAAAFWKYEVLVEALLAGNARECYDNNFFFDTDHPVGTDGVITTYSNNDTTAAVAPWFLVDTKTLLKPLIWQLRESPVFEELTEGSEHAIKHREYLYGAHARGAAGYGFWQSARRLTTAPTEAFLRAQRLLGTAIKNAEGRNMGIDYDLIVTGPSNRDALEKILTRDFIVEGGGTVTNSFKGAFKILTVPALG